MLSGFGSPHTVLVPGVAPVRAPSHTRTHISMA